jgi:hypothetical protein
LRVGRLSGGRYILRITARGAPPAMLRLQVLPRR